MIFQPEGIRSHATFSDCRQVHHMTTRVASPHQSQTAGVSHISDTAAGPARSSTVVPGKCRSFSAHRQTNRLQTRAAPLHTPPCKNRTTLLACVTLLVMHVSVITTPRDRRTNAQRTTLRAAHEGTTHALTATRTEVILISATGLHQPGTFDITASQMTSSASNDVSVVK